MIGIDIGKNSFHVVGHDARGAIVLRQKWSRGQVEARLGDEPDLPARAAGPARAVEISLTCRQGHVATEPLVMSHLSF